MAKNTLKTHRFLHGFQCRTCLAYDGRQSTIQNLALGPDMHHKVWYLDGEADQPLQ